MRTFNLIYQHNSDILCCYNKLSVKKELKENVLQFLSMALVIQLRDKKIETRSPGGERFCLTGSELNQLPSSWGVEHIVFTLAIIVNLI